MTRLKALYLLPLLCVSAAVYAADDADHPVYAEAAVGTGTVNYNTYSQNVVTQGVIGGNTTTATVLGGFAFNSYFAAELGYHDYGKPTLSQQNGGVGSSPPMCPHDFSCPHVTGLTLEGVGRFEIITDLYGEVLAGLQVWRAGAPAETYIGKSSGNSAIYGLRVRHDFHDQWEGWSFDVTYEYSEFSTSETRIGLRYTF